MTVQGEGLHLEGAGDVDLYQEVEHAEGLCGGASTS
jgi:hypothetical protein